MLSAVCTCNLSAFFLETISLPLNYYPVLSPYLPRALLPVKCSALTHRANLLLLPQRSPVSPVLTPYPLHLFSLWRTHAKHFLHLPFTPLFFALQCSIAFFRAKQSIFLTFIYFYRARRARIDVQIFIAVTFSTQNLHIRKFFTTFAPQSQTIVDINYSY